jgi:hypothetical protein
MAGRVHHPDPAAFGPLRRDLPSSGELERSPGTAATPHRPRVNGRPLHLLLDRHLARFREGAGAAVFELLSRALVSDREGTALADTLGPGSSPLPLVLLDRSPHLVEVLDGGAALGLNRAALAATRLSPCACLVAVGLVHGLRSVAASRSGGTRDDARETLADTQRLLLLLVGVRGTEWDPAEIRRELCGLLAASDPFLDTFEQYGRKLTASLTRRESVVLDDRVFRDGALFDRLPGREQFQVVMAGTLAWYGLLSLCLLRLPRRFFARRNPFYETAWWIFRAKPGGRRIFKGALLRRGLERLRSGHVLSAFELIWSSWNPILAVTCLRPVYRLAGGNRRPFLATMATFAYTALVIHPLWITLSITGAAFALGRIWPAIGTGTRIASRENLILHAIVIGFWLSVGLLVATSKALRRLTSP